MIRTLTALFLALVLAAPPAAHADIDRPADGAAIQEVIQRQIEAFRRDDGTAAFALASPKIQGTFGSAEVFMRMVRGSYPAVYRPQRIKFLALDRQDGQPVQRMLVQGPSGQMQMAIYPMVKDSAGQWRIDGCMLVALPSDPA